MASGGDKNKGPWSPEEDDALIGLVKENGPRNWNSISEQIPGRSEQACRFRWCNHLLPDVNHQPFTATEDAIIAEAHATHGDKWATIAKRLRGRTDYAVQNRWKAISRRKRTAEFSSASSESSSGVRRMSLDVYSRPKSMWLNLGTDYRFSGREPDTSWTLRLPRDGLLPGVAVGRRKEEKKAETEKGGEERGDAEEEEEKGRK